MIFKVGTDEEYLNQFLLLHMAWTLRGCTLVHTFASRIFYPFFPPCLLSAYIMIYCGTGDGKTPDTTFLKTSRVEGPATGTHPLVDSGTRVTRFSGPLLQTGSKVPGIPESKSILSTEQPGSRGMKLPWKLPHDVFPTRAGSLCHFVYILLLT